MPVNDNKIISMIEWGIIICGLFFLLLSERHLGGDAIPRLRAIQSIIKEGEIINIKYSLIMPIFAAPFYFLGSLLGKQIFFLSQFNFVTLVITLFLSYRLLKEDFGSVRLRNFLILVIMASMFTNHVNFFYGELFSACLLFLGVILVLKEKNISGIILLALAAANQPGIFLGMLIFCLYISFKRKNIKYILAPVLALSLIFLENYLKFGNIFITGYANDHGFKTIMPYSSLPGFSYPFFFGLISIFFSFGKGLLWFTPGIFLPYSWYRNELNSESQIILKSLLLIVIGIIIFYSKWWAWYGGYFWGPRFFLFVSFPAALILSIVISENKTSILKSLVITFVLLISFWVGFNGSYIGLKNLEFITHNNYALEFLIWYTPEFSVLWKPFIDGIHLDLAGKMHLIFSFFVVLWFLKNQIYKLLIYFRTTHHNLL